MGFKDIYLAGIIIVSGIAATLGGVYAYDYLFHADKRKENLEYLEDVEKELLLEIRNNQSALERDVKVSK